MGFSDSRSPIFCKDKLFEIKYFMSNINNELRGRIVSFQSLILNLIQSKF